MSADDYHLKEMMAKFGYRGYFTIREMPSRLHEIYIDPRTMKDIQKWRMDEEDGMLSWWLEDEAYILYTRIQEQGY